MIINTGARTNAVQYYAPWLLRRFEEGYALARNPLFPNKVTRYELDPAVVDCVVFCSKDYRPLLPRRSPRSWGRSCGAGGLRAPFTEQKSPAQGASAVAPPFFAKVKRSDQ